MKRYDKKYILGLDIGISSVGWGMIEIDENLNPTKIIDVGSRIFTPGEVSKTGESKAKGRREKRNARRNIRRREYRIDRVRNLLYENGYLKGNLISTLVSEKNEELTNIYDDMINNYYKIHKTNPYKLKVEALDRKLTNEEICIILVHYAKKRGYKSNREDAKDSETGKVKSQIEENRKILENYRSISEMYVEDEKFKNKIKNSTDSYKVSVLNEWYEEEINNVLDSQIKYGVIDSKFKEDYLEIWKSRRHYSKGPGNYFEYEDGKRIKKSSPYGGNLIEKMTGTDKYNGKPRAPKYAYSTESFVALSTLINLRYKEDKNYIALSESEIKAIFEKAKEQKTISYSTVLKVLKKENVSFKSLQLSNDEYKKNINDFKKKIGIDDKTIDFSKLTEDENKLYFSMYQKKLMSKNLISLKGYHQMKDIISKAFGNDFFLENCDNFDVLDELALLCTNYKTDEDIKNKINESTILPKEFLEDDFISGLPNFKDHAMLSTESIRKIIPYLLEGKRYDEALRIVYPDAKMISDKKEKHDLLVPIMANENIRNQRVIRSLSQTRKVINAVIKKYGLPYAINVETARDLAKSRDERRKIEKAQEGRRDDNENIKKELIDKGKFSSADKIKSNDLLKYKLWKEQKERCAYSRETITLDELYDNNAVQIDHILPYSRTFNDSVLNKTLVKTKYNQEKGNKTPYEWFGKEKWGEFETFINSLAISPKKKENYLLKDLTPELCQEMRNQNLNDTKYISRELSSMLKAYLNVEKVNMFPGALTGKLRARWGFNRLTHSYISDDYYLPDEIKEDIKKDRDNHLHHAMDALVIASITKSTEDKLIKYEKYKRYVDGQAEKTLKELSYQELVESEFFDDEKGELDYSSFRDFIAKEINENHVYYSKHGIAHLAFPLPYENFDKEAKIRVYQRNLDKMKKELEPLHLYSNVELDNLKVLIPSKPKNKISGSMHEETYYGLKEIKDDDKIIYKKTQRIPLTKLTADKLKKIENKDTGSKDIYEAIKNWLGDYENGEKALKAHDGKYPVSKSDKEHKEIKRVKISDDYKNTGHIINGCNVDSGGVHLIKVYTSKDKENQKLHFVSFDLYDVMQLKKYEEGKISDFNVQVWWGRDKNNEIIPYSELLQKYDLYVSLRKNDLIEVVKDDETKGIAYVVGFSSGKFEIGSVIGDGEDLIKESNLFNKKMERYQLTVSTIKSIKKLSINVLGEVNGL